MCSLMRVEYIVGPVRRFFVWKRNWRTFVPSVCLFHGINEQCYRIAFNEMKRVCMGVHCVYSRQTMLIISYCNDALTVADQNCFAPFS